MKYAMYKKDSSKATIGNKKIVHQVFRRSYGGDRLRCNTRALVYASEYQLWSDGSRRKEAPLPWDYNVLTDEEKAWRSLRGIKQPPQWILDARPCTRCFPKAFQASKEHCPTCGTEFIESFVPKERNEKGFMV
jgi:hypothetical protein